MHVSQNPNPRYGSADHSIIIVDVDMMGQILPYACSASDPVEASSSLFERARSGAFGAIAAYVAPTITFDAALILMEHDRRMHAALQGRDASMQREAIYLQNVVMLGGTLTDEQRASSEMFYAINTWETAMIDVRESLIAAQDTTTYALDATWPAAPDGLAVFLTGF